MPGIIGKNVIGVSTTNPPSASRALIAIGRTYIATAGDVIDQFFFYGNDLGTSGSNSNFAVYDYALGLPVNRVHAPVNIIAGSGISQWWGSAAGLGIPLVAGTVYCCVQDHVVTHLINYDNVSSSQSYYGVGGLPNLWINDGLTYFELSFYANVIAGTPPTVTGGDAYNANRTLEYDE